MKNDPSSCSTEILTQTLGHESPAHNHLTIAPALFLQYFVSLGQKLTLLLPGHKDPAWPDIHVASFQWCKGSSPLRGQSRSWGGETFRGCHPWAKTSLRWQSPMASLVKIRNPCDCGYIVIFSTRKNYNAWTLNVLSISIYSKKYSPCMVIFQIC